LGPKGFTGFGDNKTDHGHKKSQKNNQNNTNNTQKKKNKKNTQQKKTETTQKKQKKLLRLSPQGEETYLRKMNSPGILAFSKLGGEKREFGRKRCFLVWKSNR